MAYSTAEEANAAMRAAYMQLAASYGNNVPWSAKQAFSAQWNPVVQAARTQEAQMRINPNSRYDNAAAQYGAYVDAYPDLLAGYQKEQNNFSSKQAFGQFHWEKYGQNEGRSLTAGLERQMQQDLQAQAAQFAEIQKQQESKAEEMQQQLTQAQTRTQIKPMVAGVRAAQGAGAGMKIAGRGAGDAFRRAGIQSKSINI